MASYREAGKRLLPFTCLTPSGDAFGVTFPLHPMTRSPEQVGELTDALLATITKYVEDKGAVGNGDVLQAVAMALAVRTYVIDAPADTTRVLTLEFVSDALAALDTAHALHTGSS